MGKDSLASAERAIVGLLLAASDWRDRIVESLRPSDFDDAWPREIFLIAREASAKGLDVDRRLVASELLRRNMGVREPLREFLDECHMAGFSSLAQPTECVRMLVDRRFVRSVKARLAGVEDADELETALVDGLGERLGSVGGGPVAIGPLLTALAERQHMIVAGEVVVGHPWGVEELDQRTHLTMGGLHTVAALKGAGKSAFILHTLRTNARSPKPIPCVAFSLEMKKEHVTRRYAAAETGINSRLPDSVYIADDQIAMLTEAAIDNAGTPLFIDDTPNLSVEQIIARTRLWKRRNRVREGIVAIDFAQIVEQHRRRDELGAEALKRVAYSLLTLARTEEMAVILAAQFRNEAEREPAPRLEYIEGSGGIAQASDVVLGLHLPSRTDGKLSAAEGVQKSFEIHVLKARHGETGVVVKCTADLARNRFLDRLDVLQPT